MRNPTATRTILALAILLGSAGCLFDAPAPAALNLPVGADCGADVQCATGLCGVGSGPKHCVECRQDLPCVGGVQCNLGTGRCDANGGPHAHNPTPTGHTSRNPEGHAHVGRVAVVPVTTAVQR